MTFSIEKRLTGQVEHLSDHVNIPGVYESKEDVIFGNSGTTSIY